MGRYYDECEDRYVDAIPAMTDLATTRDYLSVRLSNISCEKSSGELREAFYLDNDDAPKTVAEMLERIASGKFIAPDPKVDEANAKSYGYRPYNAIQWRDPSKPADTKGYYAALELMQKAVEDTKDLIKTGTEKEGLEALNAFKAQTFH